MRSIGRKVVAIFVWGKSAKQPISCKANTAEEAFACSTVAHQEIEFRALRIDFGEQEIGTKRFMDDDDGGASDK